MFNIGGAELLVILLVALLVLGPNKLPQAARQVGHFLGEFRRIADGFQNELKSAMDDPLAMAPKKPPTEKPKSPGGPTVIDADSAESDSAETGRAEQDDAAPAEPNDAGDLPDDGPAAAIEGADADVADTAAAAGPAAADEA